MNHPTPEYERISVPKLLEMCQADRQLSDREVAGAVSLSSAALRLIKAGKMRLPVGKIRSFASALALPADVLLLAVLQDHQPELLEALCDIFAPFPLSAEERHFVLARRERAEGK